MPFVRELHCFGIIVLTKKLWIQLETKQFKEGNQLEITFEFRIKLILHFSHSFCNYGEADIIISYVKQIMTDLGVKPCGMCTTI